MPEEFDAWLEVMVTARWSPDLDPATFARIVAIECFERWWPDDPCADSELAPGLTS